jgi:murein DD-endopeptidase MepM/ murein hydrolase activator NlpD
MPSGLRSSSVVDEGVLPLPGKPIARRQFLRMLATAGAAAVLPIPLPALGAPRRPPFDLVFPQDPIDTWFHPTFGAAKPDGRTHMGIDLMAPKHSPVYAVADGVISRISESPRAGRYLVIDHAQGWQSWYLHLNNDEPGRNNGRASWKRTLTDGLDKGSHVSAGRQVAFVGNSGNAKGGGAHTHFELHIGSRIVNPYAHLVAAQAVAVEAAHQAQLAAHQEQLAETIRTMCQPSQVQPSIDSQTCPQPAGSKNSAGLGPWAVD